MTCGPDVRPTERWAGSGVDRLLGEDTSPSVLERRHQQTTLTPRLTRPPDIDYGWSSDQ
jgi:hypothetical protein